MNEVMVNAKTFLSLIRSAKTETARNWNQEGLQRAMQWAAYFERVHLKLKTRPQGVAEFSRGLRILNSQPDTSTGPNPVTFADLEQSTRMVLKILLQNPSLSSEMRGLVLARYEGLQPLPDGTTGQDMLNQDVTECAHAKAVRQTLLQMKALTAKAVQGTGITKNPAIDSLCDVEIQTQAAILLEYVLRFHPAILSANSIRDQLCEMLRQNATRLHGMDIISCAASHSFSNSFTDHNGDKIHECQQFIRDWLTTRNNEQCSTRSVKPER